MFFVDIQVVRRFFPFFFAWFVMIGATEGRCCTVNNSPIGYRMLGETIQDINPTKNGEAIHDTVTACDSYTWYGETYNESCDTTRNLGIDSIVTLHLTILPITYGVDSVTACDSYEWPANGIRYFDSVDTVSALLPEANVYGCDSIVKLVLALMYSDTASAQTEHICGHEGYTWYDSVYVESGTYERRVAKQSGCDSVDYLFLFVHDTSHYYVYDTCRYNQLPWTYSQREYYDKVENDVFELLDVYGCDSVVHYFLQPIWECMDYLQFPSVVTPNGDGVNDRFIVYNLVNEGCYLNNRLTIYNRWGFLIYDRENIKSNDEFWDAEGAIEGTYFFRFEGYGFTDKVERHGSFEVIR